MLDELRFFTQRRHDLEEKLSRFLILVTTAPRRSPTMPCAFFRSTSSSTPLSLSVPSTACAPFSAAGSTGGHWSGLSAEQKSFQRTKMAIHAAMLSRMDLEIGKVLKQVQAMGAEDNIMVMFLSDNGASSEQLIRGDGHDRNAPPGSAGTHLGLGPGWASCSNAPFVFTNPG